MKKPDYRKTCKAFLHSTKTQWVYDRLLRLGFYPYNHHYLGTGGGWVALSLSWHTAEQRNRMPTYMNKGYDPCHLSVQLFNDRPRVQASFRLEKAKDIHITRHLLLNCEDGWQRLEAFIQLYHSIYRARSDTIQGEDRY